MDSKKDAYTKSFIDKGKTISTASFDHRMTTEDLAIEIAANLHRLDEVMPEFPQQVEEDLAIAVMNAIAESVTDRAEDIKRLRAAIEAIPEVGDDYPEQFKERRKERRALALRHLELVGRTLPFDGFGGASDPVDEDDIPDGPGTLYFTGKPEDLEIKDCRFDVGSWTVGGDPVSVGVPSIEPIFPNWGEGLGTDSVETSFSGTIRPLKEALAAMDADPRRRG